MTIQATTLQIPEELLAAMIAETQTFRAIVANPDTVWADLAVLIEAGGIAEGDAADRIVTAFMEENTEHADYKERPRVAIRQLEDDTFTRGGGFSGTGTLLADFQLPIPSSLVGRNGPSVNDGRKRIYCLVSELLELQAQAGRLHITDLSIGPVGLNDETEDGPQDRFLVVDFIVRFSLGT